MEYGGAPLGVSFLSNLCLMSSGDALPDWRLTDCPRDALQGWPTLVPTQVKVEYLSALLQVGFDVLDAGSFVSPKAIPQMADTAVVLDALPDSPTRILAIVANQRGADDALAHGRPDLIGFPFSISETFQQRNAGSGIEEAWRRLEGIHNRTVQAGKELVVYLSMGFGNPYGDAWAPDLVAEWSERLHRELGVRRLALSDTVGMATEDVVTSVFENVVGALPDCELGAHLHGRPERTQPLMQAAWDGGCRAFDGALGGHGGCPMAKDDLVGNLATEVMMHAPESWGVVPRMWNAEALREAQRIRASIFEGA